jgi:hypothetical protein
MTIFQNSNLETQLKNDAGNPSAAKKADRRRTCARLIMHNWHFLVVRGGGLPLFFGQLLPAHFLKITIS